jgi:hypothetical protein
MVKEMLKAYPTHPVLLKQIQANFEKLFPLMEQLSGRWMDESKYENIADYQARIQKELPPGFIITKMIKRPFGFEFTVGTDAVYKITCGASKYQWTRVK